MRSKHFLHEPEKKAQNCAAFVCQVFRVYYVITSGNASKLPPTKTSLVKLIKIILRQMYSSPKLDETQKKIHFAVTF